MEYVYIVECRDGSYYTGWTNDIKARLQAHNEGRGAKYTRSRRPVHLVHLETFSSRSAALKRERAIKRLSRADKVRLIRRQPAKPPHG
ncbi:MAG: GIY-YIG nuclease family protein [Anaerovoracaceae bacterium]|jgi:putative endonuclease